MPSPAPTPDQITDLTLHPGEFRFADASSRLRTVLGSCVAITMWHPERRIGAMTHALLPGRDEPDIEDIRGYYVDESLMLFMLEASRRHTDPHDYQIKLFGGGNMFPGVTREEWADVGRRNVARATELLEALDLHPIACHVGDVGHRIVIFDVWSGDVWMRHQRERAQPPATPSPAR